MWIMIKYEFKKMFHSPLQKLFPILVIILPLIYTYYFTDHPNETIEREFFQSIKGDMDETWFSQLEPYFTVDEYGELANGEENKDPIAYRAFRLSQLKSIVLDQEWNHWSNLKSYDFIKKEMNQTNFYFDDFLSWSKLMDTINMFGILYAIYIVITITPVFSQEYHEKMIDTIKTTRLGKYQVGFSKTICSLCITILLPILAFFLYFLVIYLIDGFSSGDITLSVISRNLNPFTYQQEFFFGLLTTMTGGLGVCTMTLFISNTVKNSYAAMALSLGLLLLPTFLMIDINGFTLGQVFPFWFMMVQKVYENSPFITLNDMTIFYKDFIFVLWIPLSILLSIANIIIYRLREI